MKKILIVVLFISCIFNIQQANAFIGKQIKSYEYTEQPLNKELSTNVGGVIMKIIVKENLQNAFGRADIFGGKVDKAYKLITYMGLNEDGSIKLRIADISIMTDETTMSRYGANTANINVANMYGYTYGTVTQHNKRESHRDVLPANTVDINYDYAKKGNIPIGDKSIEITSANDFELKYIIHKVEL